MSDWDHIDENKSVPRNDPEVDRNKSYSFFENIEAAVVRSGVEYYKNQSSDRETVQQSAKRQPKKSRTLKKFTPEDIMARRKLRKFVSQQSKPRKDSFVGEHKADALQLNVINLIVFLVASGILNGVIDDFPGGFKMFAYIALWFVTRNMARKFLEKKSQ